MNRSKLGKHLRRAGTLLLGNLLLGFLANAFVIPHKIIMGGATGAGIVIGGLLHINTALIVLMINIFMLILGGIVLGKDFLLTTVASSFLYPFFLGILERVPGIDNLTGNTMLATVFAGCMLGLALGIIMRIGSSTGGTDVLNLVLHKWTHLPVSVCVWLCDIPIIVGQALYSEPEQLLYGIMLVVIESFVLDRVMLMGQSQIQIFAVSGQSAQIREELITKLQVGATMMDIETGFLGSKQQGILCVIPPRKVYQVSEAIQSIDPSVFMTVTQIKEVRGQGFTTERHALSKETGTSQKL